LAKVYIIFGALGVINMVWVYFRFGHIFTRVVKEHPEMQWFVIAFKIIAFLICTGLCVLLMGLSWRILHYLKKERE
jgi:hypothetical protein